MHYSQEELNHHNKTIRMPLRFIYLTILLFGFTSCIGLKPKPDNTKTYALGLSDLAQSPSKKTFTAKGYIARPELPAYMEGTGLKILLGNGQIRQLPNVCWAESIDLGVARTLSSYIETSDSGFKSDFYPWVQTDSATLIFQVNFHHLIATNDGVILASAEWECNYISTDKKYTGVFLNNTIEWSPGNAQSMIDGINEALKLLAAEIVDTLKKEVLLAKEY